MKIRQLVMNLINGEQLYEENIGQLQLHNQIVMSPGVRNKMQNSYRQPIVRDPLISGIRCLVTSTEFSSVKKTKFAYNLEGYKKDT